MKCIHCATDSKYSERSTGKCPKCDHAFAFEPTSGDKLTDRAFLAALERVSSNFTVKWTRRHLYYELSRRTERHSENATWTFVLLSALALLAGVAFPFAWAVVPIFAVLAVVAWPRSHALLAEADFDKLWNKWTAAHGPPKGLIARKSAPATPPRAMAEDIQHYSFDRAVVTDRPETADLLLANNFHFENNCAVITAGGYPEEAFATVLSMLRKNPKLSVYVLHDASVEGCLLAQELRTPAWGFSEGTQIIDVGLRPAHAAAFPGCLQSAGHSPRFIAGLSEQDRGWLNLYVLELAVVRPEQTIKRLFRALSNEQELSRVAEADYYIDANSFSSDASASDGGGDSFG